MIPGEVRIFVCTEPIDMRLGFDRLAADGARCATQCRAAPVGAATDCAYSSGPGAKRPAKLADHCHDAPAR